jgi:hypothetical protein
MATAARQAWQQQQHPYLFYLFLYQKQLSEDRFNTATTINTIQNNRGSKKQRRRRSKGEEEEEAKEKTAF